MREFLFTTQFDDFDFILDLYSMSIMKIIKCVPALKRVIFVNENYSDYVRRLSIHYFENK